MKNSNKLEKAEYIELAAFYAISFIPVYRVGCFSAIYGIPTFWSKIIFWGLVLLIVPLFTYISYFNRRNRLSIITNTVLPLEIYTIISTARYIPKIITIAVSVILLLAAGYFSLVVLQKIKHKKHRKEIICRRITVASQGALTIISVLLLIVTIPLGIRNFLGYELLGADIDSAPETITNDQWSLSNNIETVALLHDSTWHSLDVNEKLNVLATVKNIELRYFGIPHEVHLNTGDMGESTFGGYNHREHRITIDIKHLEVSPPEEVLDTLLHECRHVYDRLCVELYNQTDNEFKNMLLFYNFDKFQEEFNNYTNGDTDIWDYYFQEIEISARNYAKNTVPIYFQYINDYLEETNTSAQEE